MVFGEVTVTVKTAMRTFCIAPVLKEMPRIAVDQEHRFIANMVDVLIRGGCDQRGIVILPHSEKAKNNNGART